MLSLLDHGCKVTLIDNMDNAFPAVFDRMKKLAGKLADNMNFIKVCPVLAAIPSASWEAGSSLLHTSRWLMQADLRYFDELDKAFSTAK